MNILKCGCGGEARTVFRENSHGEKWWRVECKDCHIITMACLTEGEAIYTWNRVMGGRRVMSIEDAIGFKLFPTDPEIIEWLEEKFKERRKKYDELAKEIEKEEIAELKERIEKLKAEIALTEGEEKNNLCDTCKNNGCMMQYGIKRKECDFYFNDETNTIERLSKAIQIVNAKK